MVGVYVIQLLIDIRGEVIVVSIVVATLIIVIFVIVIFIIFDVTITSLCPSPLHISHTLRRVE
tara:strand:+ start:627 stop:815 length:189 start_codon:yes stop_codon:yes gene_type:complete